MFYEQTDFRKRMWISFPASWHCFRMSMSLCYIMVFVRAGPWDEERDGGDAGKDERAEPDAGGVGALHQLLRRRRRGARQEEDPGQEEIVKLFLHLFLVTVCWNRSITGIYIILSAIKDPFPLSRVSYILKKIYNPIWLIHSLHAIWDVSM